MLDRIPGTRPTISVLTPSLRPEGLEMVNRCLARQTFKDFEWLISLPASLSGVVKVERPGVRVFSDPPMAEGDFYALNKAWNQLVKNAHGDILVFCVDWIWFPPRSLEIFRDWHLEAPNLGITGLGHHYRTVVNHRPEVLWESDHRVGPEIDPHLMEFAFAALPAKDVLKADGFDEEFDQVAGMSEKDLCVRMAEQCGNAFILDERIEYRNWTHPKEWSREQWDAASEAARVLYARKRGAM